MQIRKRNTSLVHRSIASSFNFLQGPAHKQKKKETARSQGLSLLARNTITCLGQVLNLFRTEASQIVYPAKDSEAKKPYPVHPVQWHIPV